MSAYTYTDPDGDILAFRADEHVERLIVVAGGAMAVYIPNADVPTVAAELLKAAGQEATILPKTGDIVRERTDKFIIGFGQLEASVPRGVNPELVRVWAANYIALAEYIESEAQRETEAATKLQERRDALVQSFASGGGFFYAAGTVLGKAIDRIIELEDQQAA